MQLTKEEGFLAMAILVAFLTSTFQVLNGESKPGESNLKRVISSGLSFCLTCILDWLLLFVFQWGVGWVILWSATLGLFLTVFLRLALKEGESKSSIIEFVRMVGEVIKEVVERRKNL